MTNLRASCQWMTIHTKINNNHDYFVSWYVNSELKLKRFYHLFTKKEFIHLLESQNLKIRSLMFKHNNYIAICEII